MAENTRTRTKRTAPADQLRARHRKLMDMRLYSVLGFSGLLAIFTVIGMLFFFRPATSQVEKRELAKFPEFTLERFLDGSHIAGGTLFADYICPSDFSGQNTIIYGHNMKDGSMFALIDDYGDQSFFDQHPVMYLNTPTQNYRVDIFSCFTTDPESFVYRTAFASDEDYAAFLCALLGSSEVDCGVEPTTDDRIVTLSTCTYTGEDVRFVVCGRLSEIG